MFRLLCAQFSLIHSDSYRINLQFSTKFLPKSNEISISDAVLTLFGSSLIQIQSDIFEILLHLTLKRHVKDYFKDKLSSHFGKLDSCLHSCHYFDFVCITFNFIFLDFSPIPPTFRPISALNPPKCLQNFSAKPVLNRFLTYEREEIGVAIFEAGPVCLGTGVTHSGLWIIILASLTKSIWPQVASRSNPKSFHDHGGDY